MTTTNDPLLGTTYDRRYLIDRRIGSGGMANVYLAQDETLGRRVAIKVLHQRYAEDSQFVERFLREASAAAKLNHPNIVQVYDRGQASGSYYIAMEYIEGMTLKDLVRRRGALTEQEVLAYGRQALHALRFAHRNGIVHRDVKPQNMMVDTDGRLKIADFGIARAAEDADQGLTEAGSIVGTAQYLSPEQAQGHEVNAASDLYSLGVVMYEMSTGRVPFDGDSPVNVALKHVKDPVPPPASIKPGISPALESIILKAMSKEPTRRYTTADEMLADLDRARDGSVTQAMTQVLPGVAAGAAATTRVQPLTPPQPVTRTYAPVAPEPAWPDDRWDGDDADDERRRSPWRWLAPLLLVLVIAALAAFLLLRGAGGVPVPDVTGQTQAAAEAELEDAGFVRGEVTEEFSEDEAAGIVIDQNPGADAEADKGSEVDLVLSKGDKPIEVPEVAGMKLAEARAKLKAEGFTAAPTRPRLENSDDIAKGVVISSDPAAGEEVAATTPIVLVVSNGPEATPVPNVVGQQADDAEAQLEEAGFKVTRTAQDSSRPAGEVVGQDPKATSPQEQGATITLTVASGTNTMPSVVGKSEADAGAALEEAGFSVAGTSDQPTDDQSVDGTVATMEPSGNQRREVGTTVQLVIYRFVGGADTGNGNGDGNGNGNGNGNDQPPIEGM